MPIMAALDAARKWRQLVWGAIRPNVGDFRFRRSWTQTGGIEKITEKIQRFDFV
jgi:hypothetical protein